MGFISSIKNLIIELIVFSMVLIGVLSLHKQGILPTWSLWILGFTLMLVVSAILQYYNILENVLFPQRWSNEKKFSKIYENSAYRAFTSKDIEDNTQGVIDMMQLKKLKEKCDKQGFVDDESLKKAMILVNEGQEKLNDFKSKSKKYSYKEVKV